MTEAEARECMSFISKKEPKIRALFWVVVLLYFGCVFMLGRYFAGFIENVLFIVVLTAIFYSYLIISINYLYYPALKKHLNEFKNKKI